MQRMKRKRHQMNRKKVKERKGRHKMNEEVYKMQDEDEDHDVEDG